MSITTKLVVQAEHTTESILGQLESKLNKVNLGSRYDRIANLLEISSELSQFTGRSTDDLFSILNSAPQGDLKESVRRLIHQRGPLTPKVSRSK
jgi:hypothetical protein